MSAVDSPEVKAEKEKIIAEIIAIQKDAGTLSGSEDMATQLIMRQNVKDLNRQLLALKKPDNAANALTKAAEAQEREAQKHLNAAEKDMNKQIKGVEKDINKEIKGAEKDMNKQIKGVEKDINKEIKGVEKDIKHAEKDLEKGAKKAGKAVGSAVTGSLTQQQAPPTLGYWSIRGRAEQCRMLLHHLDAPFEDKQWALGDEGPDGWFSHKFNLGMTFPNLPYWHDGEIHHSGAMPVLRSICRKYKPEYLGRNLKEQAEVDASVDYFYPKCDPWVGTYFMAPDYATKIEEGSGKAKEILEDIATAKGPNAFLCGNDVTYADFMINWLLSMFRLYNEDVFLDFPQIVEYHKRYLALDGIKEGDQAMSDMLYMPPVGWQADNMP